MYYRTPQSVGETLGGYIGSLLGVPTSLLTGGLSFVAGAVVGWVASQIVSAIPPEAARITVKTGYLAASAIMPATHSFFVRKGQHAGRHVVSKLISLG